MKNRPLVWLVAGILWSSSALAIDSVSQPLDASTVTEFPYAYAGIANFIPLGVPYLIPCSGAVVKDPRIVLSAAHCMFDGSQSTGTPWHPEVRWVQQWHSSTVPSQFTGVLARGYYVYSDYAAVAKAETTSSYNSFNHDLVALFNYDSFSSVGASGWWPDSALVVDSGMTKVIVGYPSGLYDGPFPEKFLMHRSGPFTTAYKQRTPLYYEVNGVSAGPGNSGGPVFVYHDQTAKYYFAAVHVSGLAESLGDPINLTGAHIMTASSWSLVDQAIAAAGIQPSPSPTPTPLAPAFPDIKVLGNLTAISSGDVEPSFADSTDFGVMKGPKKKIVRTFSIANLGNASLEFDDVDPVFVSGSGKKYFKVIEQPAALVLDPGQVVGFSVRFSAAKRGTFSAKINILSRDPAQPTYTFKVKAKRK